MFSASISEDLKISRGLGGLPPRRRRRPFPAARRASAARPRAPAPGPELSPDADPGSGGRRPGSLRADRSGPYRADGVSRQAPPPFVTARARPASSRPASRSAHVLGPSPPFRHGPRTARHPAARAAAPPAVAAPRPSKTRRGRWRPDVRVVARRGPP